MSLFHRVATTQVDTLVEDAPVKKMWAPLVFADGTAIQLPQLDEGYEWRLKFVDEDVWAHCSANIWYLLLMSGESIIDWEQVTAAEGTTLTQDGIDEAVSQILTRV